MIDTHAHIDDEQYKPDFDEFIERQKRNGVEAILVPSVNADSCRTVADACSRYPHTCFPAVGIHPEEIKEDYEQQLARVKYVLDNGMYSTEGVALHIIAIGEIGLDYHFDTTYKEQQKTAFRTQLEWALEKDLPVMIHSRDATEDCLHILEEVSNRGSKSKPCYRLRGVMHCFSGSHETAQRVIEMGLHIGVGGVITFKNAKLADNLQGIPLESIVTETDLPYMAPVPFRGKRNESIYMSYVIDRLAQVYQLTPQEIDFQTTINAKRLFGLV